MKLLKVLGILAAVFCGIVLVCAILVSIGSSQRINRKFEVPAETVPISSDSVSIARGRHLAEAIGKCEDCHRPNLAGGMFIDQAPFMRLAAPNLTRAGVGGTLTDADWVRAIRDGLRPDGTPIPIMPSDKS